MIPLAEPGTVGDAGMIADTLAALLADAETIASGEQTLADAEREFLELAEELFCQVREPGDLRWPLQLRITRDVLKRHGLPAAELAEAAKREAGHEQMLSPGGWSNIGGDWPLCGAEDATELIEVDDDPPEPESPVSVDHSADNRADPAPQDTDLLADVPRDVLERAELAAYAVIDEWRRQQQPAEMEVSA